MCKIELTIAIVVSVIIALFCLLYEKTGINPLIGVLALISAYYGYFLLKCCSNCCKPAKRKR